MMTMDILAQRHNTTKEQDFTLQSTTSDWNTAARHGAGMAAACLTAVAARRHDISFTDGGVRL